MGIKDQIGAIRIVGERAVDSRPNITQNQSDKQANDCPFEAQQTQERKKKGLSRNTAVVWAWLPLVPYFWFTIPYEVKEKSACLYGMN